MHHARTHICACDTSLASSVSDVRMSSTGANIRWGTCKKRQFSAKTAFIWQFLSLFYKIDFLRPNVRISTKMWSQFHTSLIEYGMKNVVGGNDFIYFMYVLLFHVHVYVHIMQFYY